MELGEFVIIYNIYMLLLWSDTIIRNAPLQSQREFCDRDTSSKVFVEESERPEQKYIDLNEWGLKYVKLLSLQILILILTFPISNLFSCQSIFDWEFSHLLFLADMSPQGQ